MSDTIVINEDIVIDRNALEEECESAPGFYDYWSNREANLKTDRDNREAALSFEIRSLSESDRFEKFGIAKATDGSVRSIIDKDTELVNTKRAHRQAEANRKSYEKKIALLETLAKLHGQGYFSKIESKPATKSMIVDQIKKKIQAQIKARRQKVLKAERESR